jgi:hypothetical protein
MLMSCAAELLTIEQRMASTRMRSRSPTLTRAAHGRFAVAEVTPLQRTRAVGDALCDTLNERVKESSAPRGDQRQRAERAVRRVFLGRTEPTA